MTIQNKLLEFANEIALPYLLNHEDFQPYKASIDILLVGSSATGLCDEKSDVDICILCNEKVLNEISMKNEWNKGKPSEIIINGIQLHYYATSLENIHNKLKDFNESVFTCTRRPYFCTKERIDIRSSKNPWRFIQVCKRDLIISETN